LVTLRFKLRVATRPSVSLEMGLASDACWGPGVDLVLLTAAEVAEVGEGDTAVARADVL
jgi:hypothetical protein